MRIIIKAVKMILLSIFFISCNFFPSENLLLFIPNQEKSVKEWSILVYMAGDNDLESAGLQDLCEMERSLLNTDNVQVIAIFDRSSSYDYSYDNWSGTRMYLLNTKRNASETKLISQQIECPSLGLTNGTDYKLELSSPYVLAKSLSFIIENYPSKKVGLIMWGHGTGWRSSSSEINKTKAYAFDSSSQTSMSLQELAKAIEDGTSGRKLDFIGFDTCFGSEIEVVYELRNHSSYIAGSPGLILSEGWNYKTLFDSFELCSGKTQVDLCNSVMNSFSQYYKNTEDSSISISNCAFMDELIACFNDFCALSGSKITTTEKRDEFIKYIWNLSEGKYTHGSENDDVYIDINVFINAMYKIILDNDANYYEQYKNLKDKVQKVVFKNWNSGNVDASMGIYFATVSATGGISSIFPSGYIKGKTKNQIAFVNDVEGYVPHILDGNSLLDKLFFTTNLGSQ